MSSAEKRSGVDSGDDEILDMRELGLEVGAMESDAMKTLSTGGACEAQERGNPEGLLEVDDADGIEDTGFDDGSKKRPLTNNSRPCSDQDLSIKSDTEEGSEKASPGNEGHEILGAHVLDDSDGHNASSGSNLDMDKHDDEVPSVEYKESEEEESSDDFASVHSVFLSRPETRLAYDVQWPIENPQVAEEKMESKNEINSTTTTAEIWNTDLCKFCRAFFDNWSSVYDYFDSSDDSYRILKFERFDTISDFKTSASGGCYLCALFWGIFNINRGHSDSGTHETGSLLPPDHLKPYSIDTFPEQQEYRGRETVWIISLAFWVFKDGDRRSSTATAMMIPDDMLGSERWEREDYNSTDLDQNNRENLQLSCTKELTGLARAWLGGCCSSHSACRQQEEASGPPTRLIKIDCQEIRLCISDNESCSKYATLSHCWGKAEVLRLQKDNLQAFLKKISYDKLCKTFRDAIDIARALGFSWIWIDSLCIIQGDSEDWSKEASRMSTVYGLSSLNIAATAAPDGTIGCLFARDLRVIELHKAEVKINHQKQISKIVDLDLYGHSITNAALARRAWAVQERILAPRTLHFTESQLFWECRTKQACETFADTLPEAICDFNYLYTSTLQDCGNLALESMCAGMPTIGMCNIQEETLGKPLPGHGLQ
ncbi:hypothetical protein EAE96_009632 [Botrytis aclada]|nr:hypothetical protein EAE96_009632 [Botrytis aclada]